MGEEICTVTAAAFITGRTAQAIRDALGDGRLRPVLHGITESGSLRPVYVAVRDVLDVWPERSDAADDELAAMREHAYRLTLPSGEEFEVLTEAAAFVLHPVVGDLD